MFREWQLPNDFWHVEVGMTVALGQKEPTSASRYPDIPLVCR